MLPFPGNRQRVLSFLNGLSGLISFILKNQKIRFVVYNGKEDSSIDQIQRSYHMAKTDWYKTAVVYQIYPFSFMDADNDGWGDIAGIRSRLDYIKDLGATAVWFSPLYKSPDFDYGYDISDYRAIDEKFGTMEEFDALLKECHEKGLKVIMDMVLNHTSTKHPWFQAALSAKDSPYRDYYIIRPGIRIKNKLLPPSNWESTFTGSAWEQIEGSDDFYLHLFAREQADLNWENPRVREEIADILNFWLEKGVDGFRFDVFNLFSKTYPIRNDNQKDSFQKGAQYYVDGPRIHEFLKELSEKTYSRYDTFTVGESFHPSEENARAYVKKENHELDAIFSFGHFQSDNVKGKQFFWKPFDLKEFKKGLFTPQISTYGDAWNTLVLENHDNPRSVSRFGIDVKHYRYEAATMLATIAYLGYGTPFIYMGQEVGLTNTDFKSMDQLKDPVSHFVYDVMRRWHIPAALAFPMICYGARDHARVPMAWDDSPNGGFNAGHKPWQCVNPLFTKINVRADLESEKSIYRFYQRLLAFRRNDETILNGHTREYNHDSSKIIAYSRTWQERTLFIFANFSNGKVSYKLPEGIENGAVLLSNYSELNLEDSAFHLLPYQAVVIEAA